MRVYHESTARNLLERYFICTTYVIHFFLWLDSHMYGRDGNVLIVILNISRTNDIFIDSSSHEFSFWPILRFQHDCCRMMHDVHVSWFFCWLSTARKFFLWLMRCLYVCILWHTLLLYHACHPPPPDFLMIRPEYGCVQKKRTGLTRVLLHTRYSIVGHTRGQHSIAREASISPIFGVSRRGGPGRARVVSWGCAQISKRRPYLLNDTALISLHCPSKKIRAFI